MPTQTRLSSRSGAVLTLTAGLALSVLLTPTPTLAQSAAGDIALHTAFGFLNTGGYFMTDSSGQHAIGNPKFFNGGHIYVRPKHYRGFNLTGGFESMSAGDHFFPFEGGNEFSLTGGSFRISTPDHIGRITPYLTAGFFAGYLRAEPLGIKTTKGIPSASIGIEYPISKIFRLEAGYRISSTISGVNTNGFNLSLRIF